MFTQDVLRSPDGRLRFARSAVDLMYDWGLDGIDIHWSYPDDENEMKHLHLLLKACRKALNTKEHDNYHYSLSIAASAKYTKYEDFNYKKIGDHLDFLFLKAYDYSGSGDDTTGHSANVYKDSTSSKATKFATDDAFRFYHEKAGVPTKKIILGMPLHARSFGATVAEVGQSFNLVPAGGAGVGIEYYNELPEEAKEETDDELIAAWSFDTETKILMSYDNPTTVGKKVEYIKENKLGGAMFAESYGDKDDKDSLVFIACRKLCDLDRSDNQLSYPDGRYANIGNGKKGDKSKRSSITQWKRDNGDDDCSKRCTGSDFI